MWRVGEGIYYKGEVKVTVGSSATMAPMMVSSVASTRMSVVGVLSLAESIASMVSAGRVLRVFGEMWCFLHWIGEKFR